jgi:hypothetical protein
MPATYTGAATFSLYRNGLLLTAGTTSAYTDSAYDSFNLYWVTAQDANGTSRPSPPVSYITCTSCLPDAGLELASWSAYSMVSTEDGFGVCSVGALQLEPFGLIIYWDCIWGLLNVHPNIRSPCNVELYGGLAGIPPPGPDHWCI